MTRPGVLAALLLLCGGLTACASSRHRFDFDPAPASFVVEGASGEPLARGLATVMEGRVVDDRKELVVRVRVVNLGTQAVTVESAELVGSDLVAFGPPDLEGATTPPGESRTWDVSFAYPPDTTLALRDLTGLNLRLHVTTPERTADVELGFARLYYPPPPSRFHFGLGVGIHDD